MRRFMLAAIALAVLTFSASSMASDSTNVTPLNPNFKLPNASGAQSVPESGITNWSPCPTGYVGTPTSTGLGCTNQIANATNATTAQTINESGITGWSACPTGYVTTTTASGPVCVNTIDNAGTAATAANAVYATTAGSATNAGGASCPATTVYFLEQALADLVTGVVYQPGIPISASEFYTLYSQYQQGDGPTYPLGYHFDVPASPNLTVENGNGSPLQCINGAWTVNYGTNVQTYTGEAAGGTSGP